MRPSGALFALAAIASPAIAYPEFTVPAAGASVPGGTAFTVTWKDSGDAPSISDLSAYQLFLYSGSNASPQQLYTLSTGKTFTSGNSISVKVPLTIGGPTVNA
jgi:hypothetical protein